MNNNEELRIFKEVLNNFCDTRTRNVLYSIYECLKSVELHDKETRDFHLGQNLVLTFGTNFFKRTEFNLRYRLTSSYNIAYQNSIKFYDPKNMIYSCAACDVHKFVYNNDDELCTIRYSDLTDSSAMFNLSLVLPEVYVKSFALSYIFFMLLKKFNKDFGIVIVLQNLNKYILEHV